MNILYTKLKTRRAGGWMCENGCRLLEKNSIDTPEVLKAYKKGQRVGYAPSPSGVVRWGVDWSDERRARQLAEFRKDLEQAKKELPEYHEISVPIYRPLIVGERILETDKQVWMDKLGRVARDEVNTIHNGEHLYLRTVMVVPLKLRIK